ncbi:MAG: TonB-dependent receptor, partial [Candidatus Neomarinimicrobiota bacterium]
WGVIPQYTLRGDWGLTVVGGDLRRYAADHYGRVRSVDGFSIGSPVQYYRYETAKTSVSIYLHQLVNLTPALTALFDLKYTRHGYAFDQESVGAYGNPYQYALTHQFLDPRLGLHLKLSDALSIMANLSRAQREPADSDIYDADDPGAVPALEGAPDIRRGLDMPLIKAEELWDLELGWLYDSPVLRLGGGLYSMWFRNELIPLSYRTITDDGVPIHGNADLTVHRGVEAELALQLPAGLALDGSLTIADNRFEQYSTFEWQVDSSVNHGGNQIPGHPQSMGRMRLKWASSLVDLWGEGRYTGRIFLDRQNTVAAAIDPSLVINAGFVLRPPVSLAGPLSHMRLNIKVNNLLDSLYETFGYTYYDGWPPYRVDVYWPAATRSYFAELVVRF